MLTLTQNRSGDKRGEHDAYGKRVVRRAAGSAFCGQGLPLRVDYDGSEAVIDGTVGGQIALEIESRTPKQVRGAIMDLISHQFSKKLLVSLPVHHSNESSKQFTRLFRRFGISDEHFRVIVLQGNGHEPQFESHDVHLVRAALYELGFSADM